MRKFITVMLALLCAALTTVFAAEDMWICPTCGRECERNFCPNDRTPRPVSTVIPENVEVGDVVTFGHYPQNADGKDNTPIEWVVLANDKKENKALLLSRYGLDCFPFDPDCSETTINTYEWKDLTWERSPLRTRLNGSFYQQAFTEDERAFIIQSRLKNERYGTGPEENGYWEQLADTEDHVFLLSVPEVEKFFLVDDELWRSADLVCMPTAYAKSKGAYIMGQEDIRDNVELYGDIYSEDYPEPIGACPWWLRSFSWEYVIGVFPDGMINGDGWDLNCTDTAVRPAIWVKIV